MKQMKCLDCDKVFQAETPEEMLKTMHPHYMEEHQDIVKEGTKEKRKVWMKRFHKEWEKAKEI